MTVIDPFLDRSQSSASARLEGRELAMLRHDIRGALKGVMGAAGQMAAAELDADARRQVERICAACRTLACLVGIVLGEEPDPAEAEADRRVETDKLPRRSPPPLRRRGRRPRALASWSRPGRARPPASGPIGWRSAG